MNWWWLMNTAGYRLKIELRRTGLLFFSTIYVCINYFSLISLKSVVVKKVLNTEPENKMHGINGLKAKNPSILPVRVLNTDA